MKEPLKEKLRKKLIKDSSDAPSAYHSHAYHQYFEGYEEKYVTDSKGRRKLKRTYVGTTYVRALSTKKNILLNIFYWLLLIIAFLIFVFLASQNIGANYWFLTVIGFAGIIFGLSWVGIGLFNYSTNPIKMTIGDYKASHKRLISGTWVSVSGYSLTMLITIIYSFITGDEILKHLLVGFSYLLGALIMIIMYFIEYKMKYDEIEYKGKKDESAYEIDGINY